MNSEIINSGIIVTIASGIDNRLVYKVQAAEVLTAKGQSF